jgi:hypothetical protein
MAENEIPVNIRVHGKEEAQASLRDLGATIGEVFAVAKLIQFTKAGLQHYAEFNLASKQLAATLGYESDALVKLGQAYAKKSVLTAPEIIQGEKMLAMYRMTEKQIAQVMPALMNLAARTGSVSSAARLMGMSWENGSKRLSMYGIQAHGALGTQERLNSIVKETSKALGNQSDAAYEAMNPLKKIGKITDDVAESLGKAALPEFEKLAGFFVKNQETFEEFAKFLGDNIEYVGLGVLSLALMKTVPIIVGQIKTISLALATNPILAIAVAAAAAVDVLAIAAEKHSDKKVASAISNMDKLHKELIQRKQDEILSLKAAIGTGQKEMDVWNEAEHKWMTLSNEQFQKRIEMDKKFLGSQKKIGGAIEPPSQAEKALVVKQEQEKIDMIVKIKKENEQLNMSEGRKLIDEEEREYKERKRVALGGQEAIRYATILHNKKLFSIYQKFEDDERKLQLERMKEGSAKVRAEQEKADKLLASVINKQAEKSDREKHKIFTKSIFEQKKELKKMYESSLISDEQYSAAKKALDRETAEYEIKLNLMRTTSALDFAKVSVDSMTSIANATKANAQVKKRLAEGEAVISGGKAALGVIENSGQFISSFGPIAGPILMGVELAGIIAEAVYQVQQIESAKMAYGGVARGGTPGVDSIPAMLMPGEVVYNPAHPNPALASMINGGGMSNSNNQQTTHIHMAPIVIQGNASKTTTAEIGRVTQKALISALKEAQVNGNVSASGLVVRH